MAFSIHFVDRRKKLARIEAGSLLENFEVHGTWTTKQLEAEWIRLLSLLLGRKQKLALPISGAPSVITHAWVLYRVGKRVYIQERYFFRGHNPNSGRLSKRETHSIDGLRISEWSVPLAAIAAFLKRRPNKAVDPTTTAVTVPAGQDPRHR